MPCTRPSTLLPLDPARIVGSCVYGLPGAVRLPLPAGSIWRPGATVGRFDEGPPLLVVESGAVVIRWLHGALSAILEVAGPGDLLPYGLIPDPRLLRGDRLGAAPLGARALTASWILMVPAAGAPGTVARDPAVATCILDLVERRTDRLERALVRTLTCGVKDRVYHVLRDLAGSHGVPTSGGTLVDLPLTQELLAQMVGATRESVNRALTRLESDQLVAREGRMLILRLLRDPDRTAPTLSERTGEHPRSSERLGLPVPA